MSYLEIVILSFGVIVVKNENGDSRRKSVQKDDEEDKRAFKSSNIKEMDLIKHNDKLTTDLKHS